MKKLLTWTILTLTTFGCENKQTPVEEKSSVTASQENKDTNFSHVTDFPTIQDTTKFITDLRRIFDLVVDESSIQKANERISTYNKVKIYGSDNEFILIEYDYASGSGAAFPWKYQILLTTGGTRVKILSGLKFQFVEIFKNENPFLMIVNGTDKGNGGHEFYKFSADTLENVFEGFSNNAIQTYDAHEDNRIYEPNDFNLKTTDFNADGYNDITLFGKIVLLQGQTQNGDWFDGETINGKTITYSVDNPFKKIPVEFVFLYDKQTGHFKAKENYTEKYGLND